MQSRRLSEIGFLLGKEQADKISGAVAKVDEQSLLEQQLRFLYLKTEKQTPKSLPSVV